MPLQRLFIDYFPRRLRVAQAEPSDFKGGLYNLAEAFPQVKFIPV
jgi:hypothetical protein